MSDAATASSDVGLDLRLSEHNAPRRCAHDDCDADADWYVFTDDIFSKYVCNDHHQWALNKATPDTNNSSENPDESHWAVE